MSQKSAAFLRRLQRKLAPLADEQTKDWWERYLKGEARFRGVKMAQVRKAVTALWNELGPEERTLASGLELSAACMRASYSEDKLGGVLLRAEHLLDELTIADADALARPLADGSLSDWNVVDWYCVKVLGPYLVAGRDVRKRAREIASWCRADSLWQRRAAAVAFVPHASKAPLFKGFVDMLESVCESNTKDSTRWSQTSVGWLLRELSKSEPERVRRFCAAHPELSTEARKNALKYL